MGKNVSPSSMACGHLRFLISAVNRFFCSRDRFGEKPFYFTQQRDGFYFGSEIRQLLKVCEARTANRNLLNRFLLGVVGEGVGDTFFEGIQKLPAGHNLTYDVTTRGLRISRYFELTFNRDVARAGFVRILSVSNIFLKMLSPFGCVQM